MIRWLERPRNGWIFLGLMALVQAAYNATLPLHIDEAYYWVWSRHPELSYYDHPPMIAYLIALTGVLGDGEWSVRLVPVVCMTVAAGASAALARRIGSDRAAAWALLLFAVLPASSFGYTLATPDAPLIMFWALAALAAYRAIFDGQRRWFVATGLAVGAMMLSKYTAILFVLAVGVFLLLRRRDVLGRGDFWLAVATAALVFSPVLIWNGRHEWISFAFQYGHGSGEALRWRWDKLAEYVGGLFVIFSPILFALLLRSFLPFREIRRDARRLYVALLFVVPVLFFAEKALFKKMELNWIAIACVGGVIQLALWLSRRERHGWAVAGIALAVAMGIAVKFPTQLHLPPKANIQNRLFGYREAVAALMKARQRDEPLMADHLTTAAIISFYGAGHPEVSIPFPGRFSQYSLWDAGRDLFRRDALMMTTRPFDQGTGGFAAVVPLSTVTVSQPGFETKRFYLYRCVAKKGAQ